MRSFLMLSVATVAASALAVPAHASGAPPGAGETCEFTSLANPFAPDRQAGYVNGGPIVIADGANPRAGRLTCSIRIGTTVHNGGTLGVAASSPTTPGVVALAPTLVEYTAAPDDWITICTQVDVEGMGTFYWDDENQTWSTDPNVVCWDWWGDPEPPDGVVDDIVCPVFQALSPGVPGVVDVHPDGDVYLAGMWFWDCPPYWT